MRSSFVVVAGLAALAAAVPCSAAAQAAGSDPLDRQRHPRWEIPGFDFGPNGGWRVRARQVSAARRQALRAGRFDVLNAPMRGAAGPASAAVTGTVIVPALFLSYQGVPAASMRDTADYSTLLFGPIPFGANPYSLRTYYEQMSNGLFSMQGKVMGWVVLPSTENTYTGAPSAECQANHPGNEFSCNGIFSPSAITALHNGLRLALLNVDTGVNGINFGLFDNDGGDGFPNSGDDDGFVDMMLFAHATEDGSCGGNNHIWAHKYSLAATSSFNTNDARFGGGAIRVSEYFVQSALGGNGNGCDESQIMSIGTAAHEFGHALGLPDLYDTGNPSLTEGVGRWSLMGSGNSSAPASPARMDPWSLSELGWVMVAPAATTGTYTFGPAPTADTTFLVNVLGANPRGEYFLVENRQPVLADTALIFDACVVWYQNQTPPPCPGGLLIWHVDGTKINAAGNSKNVGPIHGLALEEADGARDLWCANPGSALTCNRGDAGDLYPSVLAGFGGVPAKTASTAFGIGTNPGAVKNSDGSFVGFAIDSIRQVSGGEMAFRLRFGQPTIVRASDTNAVIVFDGANYNVFRDLLDDLSPHTVSVADVQVAGNGRTRWRFNNWDDGGARTHGITGALAGVTIIANLFRDFRLVATTSGAGSISANPTVNLAGEFIAEGTPIQLTATPGGGVGFGGWSGDTTTANPVLVLPMGRPYTVVASFVAVLSISTTVTTRPNGVMGAAYADTLRAEGGTGTFNWVVTSGALPTGVILEATTGALAGFPRQTGTFNYTATVTSGGQTLSRAFTFSVTAPTLVTADVVTQIVGPGTPLTPDAIRYLDYLGNNNGTVDIGDFLAWVKATGAPLTAETMTRLVESKGGRP